MCISRKIWFAALAAAAFVSQPSLANPNNLTADCEYTSVSDCGGGFGNGCGPLRQWMTSRKGWWYATRLGGAKGPFPSEEACLKAKANDLELR